MIHPSILFAQQRADAENYLLRVALSAPAYTIPVLLKAGARPALLSQPDFRVMLREMIDLGRRGRFAFAAVYLNCIVGLKEEGLFDPRPGPITKAMIWTVEGLMQFALWFGNGKIGCPIAGSVVSVAWREVATQAMRWREAERAMEMARRLMESTP